MGMLIQNYAELIKIIKTAPAGSITLISRGVTVLLLKKGKANMTVCPVCERFEEDAAAQTPLRRPVLVIASSGLILLSSLLIGMTTGWRSLADLLLVTSAVIPGFAIAREAAGMLYEKKRFSIDLLIVVAAVGAFLIDHMAEGATVVLLYFIAEFLEDYSAERAKRSVASLMRLAPEVATVLRTEGEEVVHIHDVKPGEIVLVRPGERVPLDGKVRAGSSSVNQAPITGESVPVAKSPGDEVYAGTMNGEGYLEVEVTKTSQESLLSKIVELVDGARKKKSEREKFIERFSKLYTPSVMLLALGVATIPTLILGLPAKIWVYRSLVLLVVSCPCALAISTPVTMVSAITGAARKGVLIKGSIFVEKASRTRVFAFDKTGTLTEGRQRVADIVSAGAPEDEILSIAASLESRSEHPLAKAVIEEASRRGIGLRDVEDFKALPGRGITGLVGGQRFFVGNLTLFDDPPPDVVDGISRLQEDGKSVLIVGTRKGILGAISTFDTLRQDARGTLHELDALGIRTVMLTGDNSRTARAVASRLGVHEFRSDLLPQDKLKALEELSRTYGSVAMVGDGVNDAPALARADIGIAMGTAGSDVSLETADIALMDDHLCKIPYLIRLSKKTDQVVRQNVWVSILVKLSFAILAFPGFVTLWLAVAVGDMGLSLAVILNAMRVASTKPQPIVHTREAPLSSAGTIGATPETQVRLPGRPG